MSDSPDHNLSDSPDHNRTDNTSAGLRGLLRGLLPMLPVLALLAAGGGVYFATQSNRGDSTAQQRAGATSSITRDDLKQALAPLQAANQRAADEISDFQRQLSAQQGEQKLPPQQLIKDLQAANRRAADQISDFQRQLSAQQGEQKLLNQQVAALSARLDRITNAEAAPPGQAAKRNIANTKKKTTSTHPATTAGAPPVASPQDGTAAPPAGTAQGAPAGTAQGAQPGPIAPDMAGGAPQSPMSQPGASAPADMAGAPVGHRQPRAQDVPSRNQNNPMAKEDEALDKKIKSICRGC